MTWAEGENCEVRCTKCRKKWWMPRMAAVNNRRIKDHRTTGTVWSRDGAKANAIDFLEMTALIFQTEGKDGNARAARAVAELIKTDFAEPKST